MTAIERASSADADCTLLSSPSPPAPILSAPTSWRAFQQTKLYDALAAAPLTAWYAACAWQRVPSFVGNLLRTDAADINAKFILDELADGASIVLIIAVLVFLLLRGPAKARAPGLAPRLIAILGTYVAFGVVFLPRHDSSAALNILSLFLIIGGGSFAIYALVHLGRSFSVMAEARKLVTGGPYAVIRHPLYLGEAVATIGVMLQYFSPLAVALVALQLSLQMLRIANEERILGQQFPDYRAYMARSARFVPGVY